MILMPVLLSGVRRKTSPAEHRRPYAALSIPSGLHSIIGQSHAGRCWPDRQTTARDAAGHVPTQARLPARGGHFDRQYGGTRMFGKKDLVDNLSHDLDRARTRRDALSSDVTMLAAEIAQLEARLSEETDRRERERVAAELDEIGDALSDAVRMFVPAVARLCDAVGAAAAVVPDVGEVSSCLGAFARKIGSEMDPLMSELRRRADMARNGETAVQLPPPAAAPRAPASGNRMPLLLPAFLRRKEVPDIEAADDQRSTAA
jgi:hypothetical protein